jgi:hypothetical protein
VLAGIDPADILIVNPPDSIADGAEVRLAKPLAAVNGARPS